MDVFSRHGVNFLVVLILARLVDPSDFGLVALLQLFVGLAAIFVDGGFSLALVQRQATTAEDEMSVFCFNVFAGVALAIVLILIAPFIADYFDRPTLQGLTCAMAISLVLTAFGSIHVALLTKSLNFGMLTKVGAISSVVSGSIALFLAWKGLGAWSLVAQSVSASFVSALMLWTLNPWRPTCGFSMSSLIKLHRFGGYMMISGLLDVAYTRLYSVLIGRFFTSADVGYFWRAASTRQMISDSFEAVMNRVAFPTLSSYNGDSGKLSATTKRMILAMMFINVPVMLGLAVVAGPFVSVLFGEQWLPAATILQALCLAGVLWPLHTANLNALMALGRSELFFRIEVLKKIVGVVAVVGASFHSVMAVAWVQVIVGVIAFFFNAHYSRVLLGYGALQQLKDIAAILLAGLAMAVVIWVVQSSIEAPVLIELVVLVALGALAYPLMLWWIDRKLLAMHVALALKVLGFSKC